MLPLVFLSGIIVALTIAPTSGDDMTDASNANTQFALQLLPELKMDTNVFFSPFSISSAMAMVSLGARGSTLTEIQKALHFDDLKSTNENAIHQVYKDLRLQFESGNANYTLSTANRLYGQQGFDILPQFTADIQNYYGSKLEQMDFAKNAEGARLAINSWVEQQTHDKIKDLFAKGALTADTKLVLVNAIYFNGKWATQFKTELTKKEDFKALNGVTKKVDMMNIRSNFRYQYDDQLKAKVLELPYSGGTLSMYVILPDDEQGLESVMKNMNATKFQQLTKSLSKELVDVKLPKFRLETSYDLIPPLQGLGVKALFSDSPATNLSRIDGGASDLSVGVIVHKAFVDVSEEGTEAAAATGIAIVAMSAIQVPIQEPKTFYATHQFAFAIVDNTSGFVLFYGGFISP